MGGEVEHSPWPWKGAAFGVPTVLPSGVEEVGGGGAGFAHLLLRRHLYRRYSVPCQLLGGICNDGAEESVEKSDKRAHGLIPFFLLTPAVYKALFWVLGGQQWTRQTMLLPSWMLNSGEG